MGQQVGKEEFEISSRAAAAGWLTTLGNSRYWTQRTCNGHSRTPRRWHARALRVVHSRCEESFSDDRLQGPTATIDLHVEGATTLHAAIYVQFAAESSILDNNFTTSMRCSRDSTIGIKKGAQTFSVLVPQELTPGSVTVESAGDPRRRWQEARRTRSEESEDLEVDLYLDGQRLVRIVSPTTNAEILRDK